MKIKDLVLVLVVLAAVVFVVLMVVKAIKDKAQNQFASTPLGTVFDVRSVDGERAFYDLMSLKFLEYSYAVRLNDKYNNANYILDYIDTSFATDISNEIKNSNSRLPFNLNDDSSRALSALFSIKNKVQAVQVVFAFYNSTGKNLNAGLGFLSDAAMIEAANYLKNLPTGVKTKQGQTIENLSI